MKHRTAFAFTSVMYVAVYLVVEFGFSNRIVAIASLLPAWLVVSFHRLYRERDLADAGGARTHLTRRIAADGLFVAGLVIFALDLSSTAWNATGSLLVLASAVYSIRQARIDLSERTRTRSNDVFVAVLGAVIIWVGGGIAGVYERIWPYYVVLVICVGIFLFVYFRHLFLGGGRSR